jgi:hypothetical protein
MFFSTLKRKAGGNMATNDTLTEQQEALLDRIIQRDLTISTFAKAGEDDLKTLRNESNLAWGIGPKIRKGDLVLIYLPKYMAKNREQFGLRYILIAKEDASNTTEEEHRWPYIVEMTNKLELSRAITKDLLINNSTLQDWGLVRSDFRNASRTKDLVGEEHKRELWSLILKYNPNILSPLDSMLKSIPQEKSVPFELLGDTVREALAHANGMRLDLGRKKIHVEHILFALFDLSSSGLKRQFERANFSRQMLLEIIPRVTSISQFPESRSEDDGSMPPLSKHVAQAFETARSLAQSSGDRLIHPLHLWHGLFDLGQNCSVIKALPDIDLPPIRRDEFLIGTRAMRDTWTRTDLLGYARYAQAIADPILQGVTQPPITIGIQAPWGQGKTSLMRMIQERLDSGALKQEEQTSDKSKESPSSNLCKIFEWLDSDDSPPPNGNNQKTSNQEKVSTPSDNEQKSDEEERWAYHHNSDGEQKKRGIITTLDKVPTVWFNPLYYQEKEQVWASLAHAILQQLTRQVESPLRREWFWVKLQAGRISEHAIRRDLTKLLLTRIAPHLLYWAILGIAVILILAFLLQVGGPLSISAGVGATLVSSLVELLVRKKKALENNLSQLDERFEAYVREPDYESRLGFLHLVDHDMDRALELLVGDYPIAIFIDDLDRCDPQIVNKLIMAINQFLSLPHRNTIFFLGMDMEMVAASLEEVRGNVVRESFADAKPNKSFGWEFMDKFIQLPFFIPKIDPELAQGFFREILIERTSKPSMDDALISPKDRQPAEPSDSKELDYDIEEINKTTNVDDLSRLAKEKSLKPLQHHQREKIHEAVSKRATNLMRDPRGDEIQRLIEIAIEDIELNPRAIKRYLNLVRLLRNVQVARGQHKSGEYDRKLVLRAAHLLISWPRAVRWIQGTGAREEQQKETQISIVESLKRTAITSSNFSEWENKLNSLHGNTKPTPLIDLELFRFLKKIEEDSPGLSEIYQARMF